jgi:hypothetical protein
LLPERCDLLKAARQRAGVLGALLLQKCQQGRVVARHERVASPEAGQGRPIALMKKKAHAAYLTVQAPKTA